MLGSCPSRYRRRVVEDRPWYADLPELDDAGRRYVLAHLLGLLVLRDVTRDDVRQAYAEAAGASSRCGTPRARLPRWPPSRWEDLHPRMEDSAR